MKGEPQKQRSFQSENPSGPCVGGRTHGRRTREPIRRVRLRHAMTLHRFREAQRRTTGVAAKNQYIIAMMAFLALVMLATGDPDMSSASDSSVARELFTLYEQFMQPDIQKRRFTQAQMFDWLTPLLQSSDIRSTDLGRSAEGRMIRLYSYGTGPIRVLLWSQMHGDESTATMALIDMLRFFTRHSDHPVARMIRERLTLLMIPMLNPDGAERFTRRTAQNIDLNRDARSLVTPEAVILKSACDAFAPAYGFNLHDQDRHYTVGTTRKPTVIALLAPPVNEEKTDNVVRLRAKRVAAVLRGALEQFVPGHVAKWDDTFEPRAFGDNIQRRGTSTVLIESGWWADDPEKMFLRKLNCTGLLATLDGIAHGRTDEVDAGVYESIPFNTKRIYDVIYRNATYQAVPDAPPVRVDVGVNVTGASADTTVGKGQTATVEDVGDLSTFSGFTERDLEGKRVDLSGIVLETPFPAEELNRIFGN